MKNYFKLYLILTFFVIFCTGCNNDKQQILKIDESSENSYIDDEEDKPDTEERFELKEIQFGPKEIMFGNE